MTIKIDYTLHEHNPFVLQYEVYRDEAGNRVVIDRVRQEDGSYKWAVRDEMRQCLSTSGEWTYESMPSCRPEDWLETHRFGTFGTAWEAALIAAKRMRDEYVERVRYLNECAEQKNTQ